MTFKEKLISNLTHSCVLNLQKENKLSNQAVTDIHRKLTEEVVLPWVTRTFFAVKKDYLENFPGSLPTDVTLDTIIETVPPRFAEHWNIELADTLLGPEFHVLCRDTLIDLLIKNIPQNLLKNIKEFKKQMIAAIDSSPFITVRQETPIYQLEAQVSDKNCKIRSFSEVLSGQDSILSAKDNEIKQLSLDNGLFKNAVNELTKDLKESNSDNEGLKGAVHAVTEELKETASRLENLKTDSLKNLTGLRELINQANGARNLLKNELNTLQSHTSTWIKDQLTEFDRHEQNEEAIRRAMLAREFTGPKSSAFYGFFNYIGSTMSSMWNYIGSFFWQTQVVVEPEPTVTPVNTNAAAIFENHAAAILENQAQIITRFDQQTRMIDDLRLSEANVEANISALTAQLDQATLRLSEVGFIESPVAVASASPVAVATDLTSSTVGVSIALNLISFSFVHRYWILLDIRHACFKIEMWYRNKRSN